MTITTRALEAPADIDSYFRLGIQAFAPETPAEEVPTRAADWRDAIMNDPRYVPGQLRGAFLADGTFVGGCTVYEHWMPIGPARLRVGGAGALFAHPGYRHQGIGTAIVADVLSYARSRGQALLLLDAIADYYGRLGYADVVDLTEHAVECEKILAQSASPNRVRVATPDDAAALLALYESHFGPYVGRFERTQEQQRRMIESRPPINPIYVPVGDDDRPRGYLLFDWEHRGAHAAEVVADDWPAALALLQHHAAGVGKSENPEPELWWPMPPDSRTFYAIADHLPVRSQTKAHPDSSWMARPADTTALLNGLLPLWEERWSGCAAPWTGVLGLEVGDDDEGAACALELGQGSLRMTQFDPTSPNVAHLSPQAFTQLLFGYRPIGWLAEQPGQSVPTELRPALDVLFPRMQAWIAGSDAF